MDYIDILSDTTSNDQHHSDDNSKTNESIASSRSGSTTSHNINNKNNKYNNICHISGKSQQRKKRIRTIFTPEQLAVLEQEFSQQIYLVGDGRVLLAKMLNLSEAQVKVWFQNRRIKHRKDRFIKRDLMMNEQAGVGHS